MIRKLAGYFSDFHRDYFNPLMYASCLLWMAVIIALNFYFDFEDGWIDRNFTGTNLRPVFFFLTHIIAYLGCLLIIRMFRPEHLRLNASFWIKLTAGFALLGFDRSIMLYYELKEILPSPVVIFWFRCITNISSLFTMLIPLLLFKYMFDRKDNFGLYGLRFQGADIRPYWILLAIMIPIIYTASATLPGIQAYYPAYKNAHGAAFAHFYHVPEYVAKVIFECFYVSDFVFTELFFRGFLVIGFARLLGKDAVIPMAATYAALHFGKPVGECVSSIFGGYILGILALYTRNIWGGVFVHGGIALFMDIFAMMNSR